MEAVGRGVPARHDDGRLRKWTAVERRALCFRVSSPSRLLFPLSAVSPPLRPRQCLASRLSPPSSLSPWARSVRAPQCLRIEAQSSRAGTIEITSPSKTAYWIQFQSNVRVLTVSSGPPLTCTRPSRGITRPVSSASSRRDRAHACHRRSVARLVRPPLPQPGPDLMNVAGSRSSTRMRAR